MATETPVERDADLDQLHWQLLELSKRIYELGASIRRDNRQLMLDAHLAVDGRFSQVMAHLDSFIPGGCPDEPPVDNDE